MKLVRFERDWVQTHRPLGVWLLTLWYVLFAGLIPAGISIWLYFHPPGQQVIFPLQLLFSTLLGLAVIVTAGGAWRGHNWGGLD